MSNSSKTEYYRNKEDIIIDIFITIDAGSRWYKSTNDKLYLDDEDNFIEHNIDENLFEKLKK